MSNLKGNNSKLLLNLYDFILSTNNNIYWMDQYQPYYSSHIETVFWHLGDLKNLFINFIFPLL